jgi:hypothetical protein
MKTQNILLVAGALAVFLPLNAAHAVPNNVGLITVSGNSAFGSTPVSGVVGSGVTPGQSMRAAFAPDVQARVDAVGATLTAGSISGKQMLGSNAIDVDADTAQALIDVINSPAGSDTPALAKFVTSLGGGEQAMALAGNLRGLRNGNGSINAAVMSNAVNSYNTYLNSVIIRGNVIGEKPVSELDGFVQSLPFGQKAAQVLLTKLLAG